MEDVRGQRPCYFGLRRATLTPGSSGLGPRPYQLGSNPMGSRSTALSASPLAQCTYR